VAGGINLYQFSGNNPATFTDPFGLCPDDNDPDCRDKIASVKVGPILGLRYGVQVGSIKAEVFVGAEASAGVRQDRMLPGNEVDNQLVGSAEVGLKMTAKVGSFGFEDLGPGRGIGDVNAPRATPVDGDGTVALKFTIPLLWAGPVPIGGAQVDARLNVPAAFDKIITDVRNLFRR
jgi:hypothetical protein